MLVCYKKMEAHTFH